MKLSFVLLIIGLSFSGSLRSQTPKRGTNDAKTADELRALVRMWDQATVDGDDKALDRLLAEEFSFVGGINKAQYLASVKSKSPDSFVKSAVSTDVDVNVYGNTAVVTGLDTITVVDKGKEMINKWLYMDVWIKRSGRWQCVKTYSALKQ